MHALRFGSARTMGRCCSYKHLMVVLEGCNRIIVQPLRRPWVLSWERMRRRRRRSSPQVRKQCVSVFCSRAQIAPIEFLLRRMALSSGFGCSCYENITRGTTSCVSHTGLGVAADSPLEEVREARKQPEPVPQEKTLSKKVSFHQPLWSLFKCWTSWGIADVVSFMA